MAPRRYVPLLRWRPPAKALLAEPSLHPVATHVRDPGEGEGEGEGEGAADLVRASVARRLARRAWDGVLVACGVRGGVGTSGGSHAFAAVRSDDRERESLAAHEQPRKTSSTVAAANRRLTVARQYILASRGGCIRAERMPNPSGEADEVEVVIPPGALPPPGAHVQLSLFASPKEGACATEDALVRWAQASYPNPPASLTIAPRRPSQGAIGVCCAPEKDLEVRAYVRTNVRPCVCPVVRACVRAFASSHVRMYVYMRE